MHDLISRQAAIEALTGWETEPLDEDIVRTLNNLPPVTPKVSEDCISREWIKNALLKYGFIAPDMTVTELVEDAPSVIPTEQNEEDILKFYYVESLDEYWIGQRCGTRYYGKWTGNCFTYGYSRYLPWGEHVVAPDTLWKEHTYPSEPKEIPFNEWLQGFLEKECQPDRTGEWTIWNEPGNKCVYCTKCKHEYDQIDLYIGGSEYPNFCPNCGAKMKGGTENE